MTSASALAFGMSGDNCGRPGLQAAAAIRLQGPSCLDLPEFAGLVAGQDDAPLFRAVLHLPAVFVQDPVEFPFAATTALNALAVLRPLALRHQLVTTDVAVPRTLSVMAGLLRAETLGGRHQRHSHYSETTTRTDPHLKRRPRIQIYMIQLRKQF